MEEVALSDQAKKETKIEDKKGQVKWTLCESPSVRSALCTLCCCVHQVFLHLHFLWRGSVPSPATRAVSLRKQPIWALAFLQDCFHLHSAVGCYPPVHTHTHTHSNSSCISLCPFSPSCFTLKPSYFTSRLLCTGTWTLLSILLQEFKLYSESHWQMQSTYFVQTFRHEWCFLKFGADASHSAKVIVPLPPPFFLPPLCNSSTLKRHFIAQTHNMPQQH